MSFAFPLGEKDAGRLVRRSVPARDASWGEARSSEYRLLCAPGVELGSRERVCCVIGAFDGLHLGHRDLVSACIADARERGVPAVLVTFDPDPSRMLRSADPEAELLGLEDRISLAQALGLDAIFVLTFDRSLATMDPDSFVRRRLFAAFRPVSVHVGANFRFGARGAGSAFTLFELGGHLGFEVSIHELLEEAGERVSSTRVRGLLADGDVTGAAALLGRCHFVRGSVEHGRGEGTGFGFPTANVTCGPLACLPKEGVYACYATRGGRAWPAAVNVGEPPSFRSGETDGGFLEANLVGFDGDLYGDDLSVIFVERLRDSRTFSSLDELERTVLGNIDWVRKNLGEGEVDVSA